MNNVRNIRSPRPVPSHLTEVSNVCVEIDGDQVHGVLLRALLDSGQPFRLATVTDKRPLVGREDRLDSSKICFVINGPGYALSAIDASAHPDLGAWAMDENVMYRVTDYNTTGGLVAQLELADDAFRYYPEGQFPFTVAGAEELMAAKDVEDDVLEESEQEEYSGLEALVAGFTPEKAPALIRLFGGIITEVLAGVASGEVKRGSDIVMTAFDELAASEEERDQVMDRVGEITTLSNEVTDMLAGLVVRRLGEMDDVQ